LHDGKGCRLEPFIRIPSLALPIRYGSRTLGVLWACGRKAGNGFTRDDLSLLRAVTSQLALLLWGGRAVETLRREERQTSSRRVVRWLRSAYLKDPENGVPLRAETDPRHHAGVLRLADGRPALWIAGAQRYPELEATAAAAVARACLQTAAPHCETPAELLAAVNDPLGASEPPGEPWHRVVVAAATPEGGIDLAWRGESLEWEAGGGASLRSEGESAAVVDLPDGSKLIAVDGSFRICRSPDADEQSGSER
jgi:hypothetical protein